MHLSLKCCLKHQEQQGKMSNGTKSGYISWSGAEPCEYSELLYMVTLHCP